MLKFSGDLSNDYEYGIIWWGQSNSRPWGDRDLEGYAASPHLKLAPAGDDLTINRIEGFPVGSAHGYDNSTSTIYVAEQIVPNHYVGGELRLVHAEPQDPFYSSLVPAVGTIIGNGASVLGNYFVVRWTKGITRKCVAGASSTFTLANHGLVVGDKIKFVEIGAGIAGPLINTEYTVATTATPDTFTLETSAPAPLTFTGSGPCWFRASSVNPIVWKYSGYAHNQEKWKGYANIRVLTPYQPEAPGAYPAGAPKVAGYNFPSSITSYENAGVFLPFAWDEGVEGFGRTDTVTITAVGGSDVTLTLAGADIGLPDIYVGARIRFVDAGNGQVYIGTIISNTSAKELKASLDWTPTVPTQSATGTCEIALPHWRSNPNWATPGTGFRYPNNDMMPGGTGATGKVYNRPALQSNYSYKIPALEPANLNLAFSSTGTATTSGPFRTQWYWDGSAWRLSVLRNTMTQSPAAGFQFEVFLRENYVARLTGFQASTNEFQPNGFWRVQSYVPSAAPASGSIAILGATTFGGNTTPAYTIAAGVTKDVVSYDGSAETITLNDLAGLLPGMLVEFDTAFDGIVPYRIYSLVPTILTNQIQLQYNGVNVNITTTGTAPAGTKMRVLTNMTVRKVTDTTSGTNRVTLDDTVDLQVGDAFVLAGSIGGLIAGETYYIDKIHGSTQVEVRDVYGNVKVLSTQSAPTTASITMLRMHGTDHGTAAVSRIKNVPHHRFGALVEFAWRLSNMIGKRINIIHLGINSSAQIFRNSPNYFSYPGQIGWWDYQKYLDWTPSDPDGNAVRLKNVITTMAPAALQAENNSKPLKILGIVGFQGEGDAIVEAGREMYSKTLNTFYQWLRSTVQAAGLSYYSNASRIPVVHASLPSNPWELTGTFYGQTIVGDTEGLVNAAIADFAAKDGYAATIDTNASKHLFPDSSAYVQSLIGSDPLHFNGYGEARNGELTAEAFIEVANCAMNHVGKDKILEICRLALSHLGEYSAITSIDPPDGSVQAQLCAQFYPSARDSLLEMRSWSFTSKRKQLVEVSNTWTEWDYAYALPCDVNNVLAVLPPDASDDYSTQFAPPNSQYYTAPVVAAGNYNPQPYTIEIDDNGYRVLYTDQKDAVLRYNALITDTSQFTPLFTLALSWHLASMLAGPIIKGDVGAAEAKRCAQMMSTFLSRADQQDSSQRSIRPEQITPWMSGR